MIRSTQSDVKDLPKRLTTRRSFGNSRKTAAAPILRNLWRRLGHGRPQSGHRKNPGELILRRGKSQTFSTTTEALISRPTKRDTASLDNMLDITQTGRRDPFHAIEIVIPWALSRKAQQKLTNHLSSPFSAPVFSQSLTS